MPRQPTRNRKRWLSSKQDFSDVMARWNQLKTVELPAFNKQLRDAGLPPLIPESQPAPPPNHITRNRPHALPCIIGRRVRTDRVRTDEDIARAQDII